MHSGPNGFDDDRALRDVVAEDIGSEDRGDRRFRSRDGQLLGERAQCLRVARHLHQDKRRMAVPGGLDTPAIVVHMMDHGESVGDPLERGFGLPAELLVRADHQDRGCALHGAFVVTLSGPGSGRERTW